LTPEPREQGLKPRAQSQTEVRYHTADSAISVLAEGIFRWHLYPMHWLSSC
jgi:hypothetical protein